MNERDCVDPAAVQDWELMAYADGEDLEHVAEHLKRCAACRARLETYAGLEESLQERLYRHDCPSPDALRDYHWGYLVEEERQRIEGHLRTCPHCEAELAELVQFVGAEREAPSTTLLDRARAAAERARLAVARLVSPRPGLVPALRGETREVLLFEADDVALSLNLEQETTGRYTLFGQILSSGPAGTAGGHVEARFQGEDAPPARAAIDANGGFALPDLRSGVYQLVAELPDRRVVVPTLTLRSEE
jgi:anti-sigma factor RsiW